MQRITLISLITATRHALGSFFPQKLEPSEHKLDTRTRHCSQLGLPGPCMVYTQSPGQGFVVTHRIAMAQNNQQRCSGESSTSTNSTKTLHHPPPQLIALLNLSVLGFSFVVFHDKTKRTQQENLLPPPLSPDTRHCSQPQLPGPWCTQPGPRDQRAHQHALRSFFPRKTGNF